MAQKENNEHGRQTVHPMVSTVAKQKTVRTAKDFHKAANPPFPPPAPVIPDGNGQKANSGPSKPEEPEQPTAGGSGDSTVETPEELTLDGFWYLWTAGGPSEAVYHVEDPRKTYRTVCQRDKDPEVWFRTPHRPLGQIMCRFCRKNRGTFELQHEPFKQTTIPGS